MDLGLKGKVALVTGGSDGLGRAAAERLAAEGAAVAMCARGAERLAEVAEGIRKLGGVVLDVRADVSRAADCERLVGAVLERFGRLDILVNNAGTSAAHAFEAVDDAAWQSDLDLKLFAAIRLIRLTVPAMRRAGGGAIVNVLNLGAREAGARSLPTAASRAAGLAVTKALSKELAADRIRVNGVMIGLVKSGQWERRWVSAGKTGTLEEYYAKLARDRAIPLGRYGETTEFGSLVAFLASDAASYVTGVAVNFDGGLSGVP
jgi:NAD(P)-dependent dehydrogenase (short-subunit alcohol dehydrogenase family)